MLSGKARLDSIRNGAESLPFGFNAPVIVLFQIKLKFSLECFKGAKFPKIQQF